MVDLPALLDDLREESADLDAIVAPLPEDAWDTPTPADGWTIRHQIAHLAWTDRVTLLAATDPAAFETELGHAVAELDSYVDRGAEEGAAGTAADLLDGWRSGRERLARALAAVPPGTKLPWFVAPMSPASMATARIMETFAHGQDVADALGIARTPTARLRHVAHLGVRARPYGFLVRDLPAPDIDIRVELTGPDGSVWAYGPADAPERVTGPALDFCLLVTQRRHRGDLRVRAEGPVADRWLDVAQAFAGPPGKGRQPGQFSTETP